MLHAPFQFPLHRDPRCNISERAPFATDFLSFSSLYIGILAATVYVPIPPHSRPLFVSVPFTSGSSLQPIPFCNKMLFVMFQFPLHRDPRCNLKTYVVAPGVDTFQFPLHRDPRCNTPGLGCVYRCLCFSSLYIGILAATW